MNQAATDSPGGWLSRRVFLAISMLVIVPLSGGVALALRRTRRDSGLTAKLENLRAVLLERRYRHTPLADAIRLHYDYLKFAPGAVEEFVAAYQGAKRLSQRHSVVDGVERFLLSTDFFQHGADERREIHYTLLYAPMINPCYRPFPAS